jgi:pimeloyl-ACP methyl ester carboxylesterase
VVKAVDKFGHDPAYPVTNNWPHLVQQLHDFAGARSTRPGEPAFLVGHSLGGFLSVMCAARHPSSRAACCCSTRRCSAAGRRTALRAAKRTQLVGAVSPGAVSRKRKNRWPTREAALEHFRHKKAFARWDPQVLHDYITTAPTTRTASAC